MRTRQIANALWVIISRSAAIMAVFTMLISQAVLPEIAFAAPAPTQPDTATTGVNLGDGWYQITASVFAEGTDGAVGTLASSGHLIQPNDNLVSLPGCTESSCPWVPAGTGVDGVYGPQTTCVETDGQCWVEIVSEDTGQCTVAPVHDRGPFNIRDNWWAPQNQRTYNLPQGEPAAEFLARGGDLGFGPGISDSGYDVQNIWSYAAGIDIAGGTWKALGLPTAAGISTVKVRMLWQTGLTHDQACDTATTPPTTGGNATVIAGALNMRAEASLSSSVLRVLPGNSRVTITGSSQNGFYPIEFGGSTGWVFGTYLAIDSGTDPGNVESSPRGTAAVTTGLNLRASASTNAAILTVMPKGASVILNGQSSNGFLSVTYETTAGWAYSTYLNTVDEPTNQGIFAIVFDGALNLRAGAGTSYSILAVMPDGARVELLGPTGNGFAQIIYQGTTGWASSQWLTTDSTNTPQEPTARVFDGGLNLRSSASLDAPVLAVMPDGAVVTMLGRSSGGFANVRYNNIEGWAWAGYLE